MRRPIEQLGQVQTACRGIRAPAGSIAFTTVLDNGRTRRFTPTVIQFDKKVANEH